MSGQPLDVDRIRRLLWPERQHPERPANLPHVRVVVDGIPAVIYTDHELNEADAVRFIRRARKRYAEKAGA